MNGHYQPYKTPKNRAMKTSLYSLLVLALSTLLTTCAPNKELKTLAGEFYQYLGLDEIACKE